MSRLNWFKLRRSVGMSRGGGAFVSSHLMNPYRDALGSTSAGNKVKVECRPGRISIPHPALLEPIAEHSEPITDHVRIRDLLPVMGATGLQDKKSRGMLVQKASVPGFPENHANTSLPSRPCSCRLCRSSSSDKRSYSQAEIRVSVILSLSQM